jgi:hypothetical protein
MTTGGWKDITCKTLCFALLFPLLFYILEKETMTECIKMKGEFYYT